MRKRSILVGFALLVIGTALGLYASQRDCIIAFITRGYMSFWTGVKIPAGLISALIGLKKKY